MPWSGGRLRGSRAQGLQHHGNYREISMCSEMAVGVDVWHIQVGHALHSKR